MYILEVYNYSGDSSNVRTIELRIPKNKIIKFAIITCLDFNVYNFNGTSFTYAHNAFLSGYALSRHATYNLAQFNRDNTLTIYHQQSAIDQSGTCQRLNFSPATYSVLVVFKE